MRTNRWSRLREARSFRVLLVYLGASWAILEATDYFISRLGFPAWLLPGALILLAIGLAALIATFGLVAPETDDRAVSQLALWDVDLSGLRESVVRGEVPELTWGRWALSGALAFSFLFGFAGLYVLLAERGPGFPIALDSSAGPTIAVLPFRTPASAAVDRDLIMLLFHEDLDGVRGFQVIEPQLLQNFLAAQDFDDPMAATPDVLAWIAFEAGADYAVLGNTIESGSDLRISVELRDADGETLVRTQVDGPAGSVADLVDILCLDLLRNGLLALAQTPQLNLPQLTTRSYPALLAYLEGEEMYRRSRFREAIVAYTRATEADSGFAMAYRRIEQSYGWIDAFSPRREHFVRKVHRMADELSGRVGLLLRGVKATDSLELVWGGTTSLGMLSLNDFVARYPDDPEGWRTLGDALWQAGDHLMRPRTAAPDALRKGLDLDPGIGPAYFHLIEDALIRQDSAASWDLISRHRRIDPENPAAQALALVWTLTWEDKAARARAITTLPQIDSDVLHIAAGRLYYSGNLYRDQLIAIGRALLEPSRRQGARLQGRNVLIRVDLARGRVADAAAALTGPEEFGEPGDDYRAWHDLLWYLIAYPVLPAPHTAAHALAQSPRPGSRFGVGAFAAATGDWERVHREVERLESDASAARAVGDSTGARRALGLAEALNGYAALRRGDPHTARMALETALPDVIPLWARAWLRLELGKLYLEQGDLHTAERYFRTTQFYATDLLSNAVTTPTEFYLGQLYRARGDRETARKHYSRFVDWWNEADPELWPWRQVGSEALEVLNRLTADSLVQR